MKNENCNSIFGFAHLASRIIKTQRPGNEIVGQLTKVCLVSSQAGPDEF